MGTGTFCETKKQTNPCNSHKCINNSTCIENGNSYSCKCSSDFTGSFCETKKQDTTVDPCKSNLCVNNSTCLPENNSYKCQCIGEYEGKYCENKKQIETRKCQVWISVQDNIPDSWC